MHGVYVMYGLYECACVCVLNVAYGMHGRYGMYGVYGMYVIHGMYGMYGM